jgi:G3E family GTPase
VRVPVLVVTGFLGAGKTTLVNALLARRAARQATGKLGVIVNELGEVGIDGALLAGGSTRQIELPGGCVCCVLGDDLDRTLIELCDANPELEAIVLETTGVAEPLPISWALAREPVATLVDALAFRASRPVSVAVDAQVAYADVLLVTKSELAGPAETEAVTSEIRTLASRALLRIGGTDDHVAWLEQVLADPSVERVVAGKPRPSGQPPRREDPQDYVHVHDDDCRHLDGPVHGIDTVWVPVDGVVDLEELEDGLAELPANYVRIKGILRAVDSRAGAPVESWVAVHRVGPRVSSEPISPPDLESGRLVALGPSVTASALATCVEHASTVAR